MKHFIFAIFLCVSAMMVLSATQTGCNLDGDDSLTFDKPIDHGKVCNRIEMGIGVEKRNASSDSLEDWLKSESVYPKLLLPLLTSVFGVCIGAFLKEKQSEKSAYRTAVIEYLPRICDHIDSMLAKSHIFMYKCEQMAKNPQLRENEQAKEARKKCIDEINQYKKKLGEDRRMARCLLWDPEDRVVEAMKALEKVCGWITQFMSRPNLGIKTLEQADEVRKVIDLIGATSFKKGEFPKGSLCRRLDMEVKKLRLCFGENGEQSVIAGVDFVIPNDILSKYKKRIGLGDDVLNTGNGMIKVYEMMLNVLDKG